MDKPLRVVIDTNVLVSGTVFRSSIPADVLAYVSEKATILISGPLFGEYHATLLRPKFDRMAPHSERADFLSHFVSNAHRVYSVPSVQVCRDPKDDMLLALALGGRADVIVSGDQDLLSLSPYDGIPIVTPREFLTMVREHDR